MLNLGLENWEGGGVGVGVVRTYYLNIYLHTYGSGEGELFWKSHDLVIKLEQTKILKSSSYRSLNFSKAPLSPSNWI